MIQCDGRHTAFAVSFLGCAVGNPAEWSASRPFGTAWVGGLLQQDEISVGAVSRPASPGTTAPADHRAASPPPFGFGERAPHRKGRPFGNFRMRNVRKAGNSALSIARVKGRPTARPWVLPHHAIPHCRLKGWEPLGVDADAHVVTSQKDQPPWI
jgi:hypothetical protein